MSHIDASTHDENLEILENPLDWLAGKYMTFKLEDEEYGLRIQKVLEIIGVLDITRVPKTEAYIRGVINLRGKVIPVMDLRVKFDMTRTEFTDQTVIIVIQGTLDDEQDIIIGVLVDEVLEVMDVQAKDIEKPSGFYQASINMDFILGMGKIGERVVFLLDMDRIVHQTEKTS